MADDTAPANGMHVLSFQQALKEALKWFDSQGIHVGPYKVADAAKAWLDAWKGSDASKRNSEGNLKHHILPTLGQFEIAELKREQVQEWLQDLAKKPPVKTLSQKSRAKFDPADPETRRKRRDTANRIFNDLSALLTLAYENGKVQSRAAWETVKKFENVDLAKNNYLTLEEAKRLIESCPQDFRDLVKAALIVGARYMDLARLTVGAYDPQIKAISLVQGKTGKPKHVYLTDDETTFFEQMTAGKCSSDLLFTQQDGKPWVKSSQQPRMRGALKAAGINRHVRFHDLRHTFATLLIMSGTSIQLVANQLGHSGSRIAEKHYSHFSPSYIANTIRANKPRIVA